MSAPTENPATAGHTARARFDSAAPGGYKRLAAVSQWLADGGVDPTLLHLIDMRVSQLNGCAYCLDMHAQEAREAGETQQRLDVLAGWDETGLFTEAEKAVLAWAEALTRVGEKRAPQALYDTLAEYYDEREIAGITLAIAMMNAWNRLAVGLGKEPEGR
ncbi:MAG: carboxymuconolactone decarboxylase family protein [Phycisphaera sp.]|nr:MAG: carboxymuconolactone decarboxylase family protein [Phycisphaera sp.]